MKRGTEDHPKAADLADRLDLSKWEVVGLLEALWIFTAKYAPRGDVGKWSAKRIATWLEWTRTEPERLLEALIEAGFIDRDSAPDSLLVHDWPDHADDAVHMALARGRLFFANGRAPKLGRLPKEERASAEQWYESHQHPDCPENAPTVDTSDTRRGHAVRTACRSPVRSGPAPPKNQTVVPRADARSPAAPAEWALRASEALRESVRRRWPGAPAPESLVAWAREVERIRAPSPEVEAAMAWYVSPARDSDRYVPECRSGRSFREKFDKVLAARKRAEMPAAPASSGRPEPGGRAYRPFVPERREGTSVVSILRELRQAVKS